MKDLSYIRSTSHFVSHLFYSYLTSVLEPESEGKPFFLTHLVRNRTSRTKKRGLTVIAALSYLNEIQLACEICIEPLVSAVVEPRAQGTSGRPCRYSFFFIILVVGGIDGRNRG